MTGTILVAIVVITLAVGLFIFRAIPALRAYFDYRGKRLITCPETHKAAAVNVAAREAAVGAFLSEPRLRLTECSRWPERKDCGQECLKQIEVSPENCLVWNIVSHWYDGKQCVFCHKSFGELHHLDHAPALLGPDHKTAEWRELRPEQLPEIFSTHRPVCWNCHVAETFRRLHPELVVDRELEPKRIM
ncbi:MAG: hypothetical protein WB523_07800 [Candidatus Sulfotelmatobacter sp.]